MNFALRVYRRLSEAFPHEFKMVYGTELTQLGEDVVEDIAKRHGAARTYLVWFSTQPFAFQSNT